MLPNDRLAISKAVNQERNRIRSKLQRQGTQLLREISEQLSKEHECSEGLMHCLASADTYVKLRKTLMPEIAGDGITNQIAGKASFIKNKLK